MYVEEELTIETIRKKIGVTFNTIKGFLKRNGVKVRNAEESRNTVDGKPKRSPQRLSNPNDLNDAIEMYNNGEVLEKIGIKYGISPVGLRLKFIKHGVKLRTLTESANLTTTYDRKKTTCREKYGQDNPMQNSEINEKSNINRFKFKSCDINGRTFSHLQGFEPQGIKYLIQNMGVDVNEIDSGRKVPKINYKFEGKDKIYFADMYIKSKNLLVEIKCEYTYNSDLEKNEAKREAVLSSGFNYKTLIFNNKGDTILEVF